MLSPLPDIIHCVGPVGEKPAVLQSTYRCALELCTSHSLKSIAFPCISTGVYGYPPRAAAEVAISTVLSYLSAHKDIERVIFCVFLPEDYEIYKEQIPKHLARYSVTSQ
ncbi:Appr-1-p processing enzyme family protein [Fasciolopsis buskii]|uniref:Appr-1-p processing enzyme family protein n=1 Tax=Fasciolopsis buskii TaxID=27845 RepID=A0A8E0S3S7_9TREM|nr:Appr-1-p processing enzyme family protein [Fasciolopsis buski]